MKVKKLTNKEMHQGIPLKKIDRDNKTEHLSKNEPEGDILLEYDYDDDVSNIENAFNIPIPPDITEPCALFIVSDIGIFAVENMTLKDVILLIRKNNFQETSVEIIPPALLEKLNITSK